MAIARKVVVSTNEEGLVVLPVGSKGQRPSQPLLIKYGDASIFPVPRDSVADPAPPASSIEAFGVIGRRPGVCAHPLAPRPRAC